MQKAGLIHSKTPGVIMSSNAEVNVAIYCDSSSQRYIKPFDPVVIQHLTNFN